MAQKRVLLTTLALAVVFALITADKCFAFVGVSVSVGAITPLSSFRFRSRSRSRSVRVKMDAKKEVDMDDLLESEAFLNKKVEVLQKQIESTMDEIGLFEAEAEKEWEEWGSQIERLQDEFKFLKARMLNDTMEATDDAKVKILKELITVSDNFHRASDAISPETEGEEAVKAYYENVFKIMEDAFSALGMEEVPTVGSPFDFNFHEAVMRQASELDEDVVCAEFAKGYLVGERVVRPAMVAVSMGS